MLSHTFELANGTTKEVPSGGVLPTDLPKDFAVMLIPEDFVECIKEPLLVQTNLSELLELARKKKKDIIGRSRSLYGATKSINDVMPRLDDIYAKAEEGDTKAELEWRNFCDDVAILACVQLSMGNSLRVLLNIPTMISDNEMGAMCFMIPGM